MTREEGMQRLQLELKAGVDGVFIVVSDRTPILGGPSILLGQLLGATTSIGEQLRTVAGTGPVEVPAIKGVSDDMLRSLNHRRDQLRVGRAVLLVFDPTDCKRVSRVADDLWKWATVVELDRPAPTRQKYTEAHGVVSSDRYAPPLRADDVVGPREPLTAPLEDSDS